MRNLITATILATAIISTTNTASAATLIVGHVPECSYSDIAIGVGLGVAATVAIAVTAVATSPVAGASGTVGFIGAMSAPFLGGSTLPAIGAALVIEGPLLAITGAYLTCVYTAVAG